MAVDGVWKVDGEGKLMSIPTVGYVGSAPSEVILSLLVNNDDVSVLNAMYGPEVTDLADHVMAVDWIRVWR